MKNKSKIILIILAVILAVVGGLFIYEVKKEHHYTPVTAEIVLDNPDVIKETFIIKDGVMPALNLAEHLSVVSDVENGTANLETTKKVFGFYG